jgi:alkylated DNA repair dioxygenase AlkB
MRELLAHDGSAVLHEGVWSRDEAQALVETLRATLAWESRRLFIFGRWVSEPRRSAWYGDPGARYHYSGTRLEPLPWTAELERVRHVAHRCAAAAGTARGAGGAAGGAAAPFNSVLANLYRDGNDTMGWHADDEPELGPAPVIASVSLGAERRFDLRHRETRETVRTVLPSGSVLVMSGATQRHWVHAVPRQARVRDARINLTYRTIVGTP